MATIAQSLMDLDLLINHINQVASASRNVSGEDFHQVTVQLARNLQNVQNSITDYWQEVDGYLIHDQFPVGVGDNIVGMGGKFNVNGSVQFFDNFNLLNFTFNNTQFSVGSEDGFSSSMAMYLDFTQFLVSGNFAGNSGEMIYDADHFSTSFGSNLNYTAINNYSQGLVVTTSNGTNQLTFSVRPDNGTSLPEFSVIGLPIFIDEAAAAAGFLTQGCIYQTPTGELRIKL